MNWKIEQNSLKYIKLRRSLYFFKYWDCIFFLNIALDDDFFGSPTHQLSKYLTTIIQPLTDRSRRKLQSKESFIDTIKTTQIPDDHRLVSFDVKPLFTSIPLHSTETAIQQSILTLPLPTEDIMDLLNLCPTSTCFQYNGKQLIQTVAWNSHMHGSAVSVVEETVM